MPCRLRERPLSLMKEHTVKVRVVLSWFWDQRFLFGCIALCRSNFAAWRRFQHWCRIKLVVTRSWYVQILCRLRMPLNANRLGSRLQSNHRFEIVISRARWSFSSCFLRTRALWSSESKGRILFQNRSFNIRVGWFKLTTFRASWPVPWLTSKHASYVSPFKYRISRICAWSWYFALIEG